MVNLSPTLSQQPTPVGQTSAVGFGSVGQGLANLGNVFSSAAPEQVAPPSVAEQRFVLEQRGMEALGANLSAIVSNPDMTPEERQLAINTSVAEAASYGIDPRTGAAGAMVESYLGIPAADAVFSQDQRLINDLQGSAEGQGVLFAAQAALFDPENPQAEITASDVAQEIRRREALEAERSNMEANWDVNGKTVFTNYSNQLLGDAMSAYDTLTASGVTVTNVMLFETRQVIERQFAELVNQTGSYGTDPIVDQQKERINYFLDSISAIANPTSLDVDTLTPRQLQMVDRVAAILNSDDPEAILAGKLLEVSSDIFNMSGEEVTSLIKNIGSNSTLQGIVTQQPRWMEEAGILNSNNMFAISEAIVNQSATLGGAQTILSQEILSSLPSPADGETYTPTQLSEITQGVLAQVQSVDVPVQDMNGSQRQSYAQASGMLAATLHYHTLDLDDLAGSYYSATKARQIGTTIVNSVNNIRQYDPEAALAIQTTAYTGLGRMRANAEAALSAVESEGLLFQQQPSGRLTVRYVEGGTPEQQAINQIVDRYYDGDLQRMTLDPYNETMMEDPELVDFLNGLAENVIYKDQEVFMTGNFLFDNMLTELRASVSPDDIRVGIEARNSLRTFLTLEEQLKPDFVREYEEAAAAQQQAVEDIANEAVNTVMALNPDVQLPPALSREQGFVAALNSTAGNLALPANWLLALINFESGGRPDSVNDSSKAAGLIQFMPATAENLGVTTEELLGMSATEQMKYVEQYLRPYASRIKTPEDMYMAVFFPHAIGKPDDFVLGSDGRGPSPSKIAQQNPIFNPDGNSEVTAGDVRRVIMNNSRFTDYLNGVAPSEIQVSTLPAPTPDTPPERPQTSIMSGMAAPATQVQTVTGPTLAGNVPPMPDTVTPFMGAPRNPDQPVVPQEIADNLSGVAGGVGNRNNSPLAFMGVEGSGTQEDPIIFTSETGMTNEMYQAVPAGAYYRDPTGRLSQKRAGSRADNNGGGVEIKTPNGIEEYNALPSGTRWRDPDGNIRIKP